jgi:hypothetical protein
MPDDESVDEALPPPGWYTDPGGKAALRWWDGFAWAPKLDTVAFGKGITSPRAHTLAACWLRDIRPRDGLDFVFDVL